VPDASNPSHGCSFHTRCQRVIPPADLDVETGAFRTLLDYRFAVEAGDLEEAAAPDAETDVSE